MGSRNSLGFEMPTMSERHWKKVCIMKDRTIYFTIYFNEINARTVHNFSSN